MSSFDVWVMRFEPGEAPPAERLQATFGIDISSARALEANVPKVVKHGVPAKTAGEMRQALEAIGAVVECRPAPPSKPEVADDSQAVFRPPGADLFPDGRVSAIDPFKPASDASVPRISVDEAVPPAPPDLVARTAPPSRIAPAAASEADRRRIGPSLLATSQAQQRQRFLRQAVGSIAAGATIIGIGWFFGDSVLRGEAGWLGIAFDGLGIYFIGAGVADLVATLRS
jgi:hypothetical protein